MEFEVKTSLAILLDREGNYISVSVSGTENNTDSYNGDEQSKDQSIEPKQQDPVSPIDNEILRTGETSINIDSKKDFSKGVNAGMPGGPPNHCK